MPVQASSQASPASGADGGGLAFSDLEVPLKVVVVGSGGVGKSSLIRRFTSKGGNAFASVYKKTIGVEFAEKVVSLPGGGGDVRMMLWDTAGQDEFDALARQYYQGAHAVLFCFSVTDRGSFSAVEGWKRKVDSVVTSAGITEGQVVTALVMNKIDEEGSTGSTDAAALQNAITGAEARELAAKLSLPLYPVSVKTGKNVDALFRYLAEKHVENQKRAGIIQSAPGTAREKGPWHSIDSKFPSGERVYAFDESQSPQGQSGGTVPGASGAAATRSRSARSSRSARTGTPTSAASSPQAPPPPLAPPGPASAFASKPIGPGNRSSPAQQSPQSAQESSATPSPPPPLSFNDRRGSGGDRKAARRADECKIV